LGALRAGILLWSVWAVWHFVPLAQVHRSTGYIAWWSLGTVAQRALMTWLYNNTGRSVFAATVFHATDDLSTVGPFLDFGPGGYPFDAVRISGLLLTGAAAVVTVLWGPATLARRRHLSRSAAPHQ
jgi:membrane protease YdiL (CAAX protease family)